MYIYIQYVVSTWGQADMLLCIVTNEDLRGRNVYISISFTLLRDCSTICPVLPQADTYVI